MKRDKFTCQCCGDKKTMLNIHHKEYTAKDVWDEPSENLETLCKHCHFIKHEFLNKYKFNEYAVFELEIKKAIVLEGFHEPKRLYLKYSICCLVNAVMIFGYLTETKNGILKLEILHQIDMAHFFPMGFYFQELMKLY